MRWPIWAAGLAALTGSAQAGSISSWRSVRVHGAAGSFFITLDPAVTSVQLASVEPRHLGIQRIEVQLTASALFDASQVHITGIGHVGSVAGPPVSYMPDGIAIEDSGKRIVLLFNPGTLPDETYYTFDLTDALPYVTGDRDCVVRSLAGDVDTTTSSAGMVSLSDVLLIKARAGQSVSTYTGYDMDTNGSIDLADALAAKAHVGKFVTSQICTPGTNRPCYTGPAGTQDVGPCHAGQQVCQPDGGSWGACTGQVLPAQEICNNGIDEDCNGVIDDNADADGDGWTQCDGDCCDAAGGACGAEPALVNPGAFELMGNGIDDDCDPSTSDTTPPSACSTSAKFAGVTSTDLAQAMDICQTTTASPPLASKKWGLISAQLLSPNGTAFSAGDLANVQNYQVAVLTDYGTGGVVPTKNNTMVGISTGRMRDQADPNWTNPVPGGDFGRTIAFPAGGPLGGYLAQHGGQLLAGSCGSSPCPTGTGANDGVLLRLTLRVPTNAQSFSYDFRFFSAEYQTYQCTAYNDYFLVLLTSGARGLPADKNLAYDATGKPVTVNNGFFQICGGNGKNCNACPYGTGQLAGTGMQTTGGGTPWLTTDAPVVPGETITLDFILFDVSDRIYDSLVLIDNFRWSVNPASVSTHQ